LLILVGGGHFYQFARADGLICQNFARFWCKLYLSFVG
jgi:hypothetical protein